MADKLWSPGEHETGRGTNKQGNDWISRMDSQLNQGYEYKNRDGSNYVRNFDGSSVFDAGNGFTRHTDPQGQVSDSYNGAASSQAAVSDSAPSQGTVSDTFDGPALSRVASPETAPQTEASRNTAPVQVEAAAPSVETATNG